MMPPKASIDRTADRALMLFQTGMDIVTRHVYFTGAVNTESVEQAVKGIHLLSSTSNKPIVLWISSPGGELDQALHLYDVITLNRVPILTMGSGEICSAATILLAAGKHRVVTPNSFLMAHDASVSIEGGHDEVQATMAAFRKQRDRMFSLLEKHTKLSSAEWKKRSKAKGEIWLSPEQMLQWGVVDEILRPEVAPKRRRSGTAKAK